jgi:diacylglycerol kinase family enzyme
MLDPAKLATNCVSASGAKIRLVESRRAVGALGFIAGAHEGARPREPIALATAPSPCARPVAGQPENIRQVVNGVPVSKRPSRGQPSWPARLAAIIALLAPLAMAIVAAFALAGDVAVAVLAVVLALLTTGAVWFALTRRGPRRAAGIAAAALTGAGLLVVLVTNWQGLVVLVALLALLAGFGAAARYALGTAVDAAGERRRVAPAAGSDAAALIINLKSGAGKAQRFDLAAQAVGRGVEPIVLGAGDDLAQLAEDAVARGARVIGMAGGDGSQALVATVAARLDVAYVCVPAGTRNHFALDLGLNRDDVIGALDAFTGDLERRIDLAQVNDRVFVNNASLGVYARVVQSDAYRDAKLQTWARMLPDLLGPDAEPIDLSFTTPDGYVCDDAPLVLVSNNVYQLTQLAGAGTRERIDAGTLGIVAARVRSAADASALVALELVGQVGRFAGLMSWSAREFEVRSSGPVEIGLDGEALVLQPPLRFKSLPGALRVRLPPGAGVSPAARAVALSGDNLSTLLRVAAGR